MNPLPIVWASLRRNGFTSVLFVVVVALVVAFGIAISAQERALRSGSVRAADKFDLIVAAPGSFNDVLLSTVYLNPSAVELLDPAVSASLLAEPATEFVAPIGFGDSIDGAPLVGTIAPFVEYLSGGLGEGRMFARSTRRWWGLWRRSRWAINSKCITGPKPVASMPMRQRMRSRPRLTTTNTNTRVTTMASPSWAACCPPARLGIALVWCRSNMIGKRMAWGLATQMVTCVSAHRLRRDRCPAFRPRWSSHATLPPPMAYAVSIARSNPRPSFLPRYWSVSMLCWEM